MRASDVFDSSVLADIALGELFVPQGGDLDGCVCAVASRSVRQQHEQRSKFKHLLGGIFQDGRVAVVVAACCNDLRKPASYPVGYLTDLPGRTLVRRLSAMHPIMGRPRLQGGGSLDAAGAMFPAVS